ncbi:MAG TPA: T9SS type A sorting domain-containing protein [Flavobacteriales bacterium]|nr:T9SS type A sorting domain-containing protein [Flavobacteriales bacterium]
MRIASVFIVSCSFGTVSGQSVERAALASGGASLIGPSLQLHQTIGQAVFTTLSAPGLSLTQGFQQPYEDFTTGVDERVGQDEGLMVFPNPTNDILHVHGSASRVPLTAHLVDAAGRSCPVGMLHAPDADGEMTLDLASLAAGTYLLRLQDSSGALVGTCRVIKLN